MSDRRSVSSLKSPPLPGSQQFTGSCFSVEAIRELDKRSAAAQGLSEFELMQRAGYAAFAHLINQWPTAKRIAVLCGTGNNGGDGWVIAKHLEEQGLSCDVFLLGQSSRISGAALEAHEEWRKFASATERSFLDCADFGKDEIGYDVVVDALVGIGFQGLARPELIALIDSVNQMASPVLSLDIPSGLNADTGEAGSAVIEAHTTLTFIAMKPGLLTGRARDVVGRLVLEPLATPSGVFNEVGAVAHSWAYELPPALSMPRRPAAHKGSFGHVLVVGGHVGMGGAAILAASAALRAGAGLVSLATRSCNVPAAISRHPEVMTRSIDQPEDLSPMFEDTSVIVVGPGLGMDGWSRACLKLVQESNKPLVVDADALNLLAEETSFENLTAGSVLTPHPGEAARLASMRVADVEANRFHWAQMLARQYQSTVILKGAGSIVAPNRPGDTLHVCSIGNPGMATGGMGDVLAGLVGSLLAQGYEAELAALGGTLAHAAAGDLAWREYGIGLTATDVIDRLGAVLTPGMPRAMDY